MVMKLAARPNLDKTFQAQSKWFVKSTKATNIYYNDVTLEETVWKHEVGC